MLKFNGLDKMYEAKTMKNVRRKIVIAGGLGFLGRTLIKHFANGAYELVVLSRNENELPHAKVVVWDGIHLDQWAAELEGAELLINLAGRSVNCRYNRRNRCAIMDSRVFSTRVLGQAVQGCRKAPGLWINSSTATIYKHRFDSSNDEKDGLIGAHPDAKDAFSVDVALAWEKAFREIDVPGTRKVIARTAMVFGSEEGGVYEVLRKMVCFGLGGKVASGRQYVSWLHEKDFCGAIEWLMAHKEASGVYNLCSPCPLTNREMMKTLRDAIGVSFGLPAMRLILDVGALVLRTEVELMIKSRRVVPARLEGAGYVFTFPCLQGAIKELEQKDKGRK